MDYQKELHFVEKLLQNFRLKLRYLTTAPSVDASVLHDLGLKDILNYSHDEQRLCHLLEEYCKPNTIYQICNPLLCNYLLLRLPNSTPNDDTVIYAYIGPYTLSPITHTEVLKIADSFQVTPGNLRQLEEFYQDLPLITNETALLAVIYTLGEYLWGGPEHFTTQTAPSTLMPEGTPVIPAPDAATPEEALLSMQILEKRYELENQLLQAVSNGQPHKAEMVLTQLSSRRYDQRTSNPLRNFKNYALSLNTLLRKSVESAAVHPIHIDRISSQYASRIELAASESALFSLVKEMIRKYCLLVKNHSMKGYSLLIRKVITQIDYDLTADLSLKTQAQLLDVNPSYLSTLFKRETGITLTEYVNRKRIEHAILLLNSTDMQVQMIAQYCGIPDVNYFTKTFKKIVGRTPKEYREMISGSI